MQVEIDLVYDGKPSVRKTVEVKDSLTGRRFLNAIERAVEKAFKDDKDWVHWNLINIIES